MTRYAISSDGTRIAFDRLGRGAPIVLVSGIFCDRATTRPLAERLAAHGTVLNYDRRGRGESSDTAPYAIAREVDDLRALIAEAGGMAAVYGHSSGGALALHAAAAALPITRLVIHEPPYSSPDAESTGHAQSLAHGVTMALAAGRRAEAITQFFASFGLPPDAVESMARDPRLLAVAPTMAYDFEIMGDAHGGTVPEDLVRAVRMPTLALAGAASPGFFQEAVARIAALLPDGTHTVLEGHDHGAPAEVVAPVVAAFLAR